MTGEIGFPNISTPVVNLQNGLINLVWYKFLFALWNDIGTTGDIKMIGGDVIPPQWIKCDGSAVSRTQYKNLFAAIGTTWGIGDGKMTFNLPNLEGSSPLTSHGHFVIRY